MTELDLNLEQRVRYPGREPALPYKSSPRWERVAASGVLSLFVVGAGQLYNRQPRKALVLALTIPILQAVGIRTRVLFSFGTMVSFFALLICWRLFITAEAAYNAWALRKPEVVVPHKQIAYPLITAALLVLTIFPSPDQFKRWSYFGAFKIPSASMCPTICMNERIVADMGAYKSKPLGRGDIILLKYKDSPALSIKRIIGVSGDVVTTGPDNAIFVNGKRFVFPTVCRSPVDKEAGPVGNPALESTKVAEGTYFVVGDNLSNSFDSRFPEFGPVVREQLRGKPLYIYWSPRHSRIGCRIR